MEKSKEVFCRNILGDTKETIEAIQRFLAKNSPAPNNSEVFEDEPAGSINRIIKSIANEDTENDIQKIINKL